MKQLLQNLKSGNVDVADVPAPGPREGHLLVQTSRTLVSAGTERMLVEFGKAGWINKARQQPDKVRQVIGKMRTDGIGATLDAVKSKLDQPLALGYCNVGRVVSIGPGVEIFQPGDRVASNGKHAEIVSVPTNLCARIPDAVSDDEASFTVLAAIGLQGIRLVRPTLGEAVVVTGLGLIGLMTVQLLRAHGCRVLGIDFDSTRLQLARDFGAEVVDLAAGEDPIAVAQAFSRGRGVDAAIITASTTSNEPIRQAANMCRKRGRIVLVGVTGLELSRADFYEKELSFQVSCSYGPGRHDPVYEQAGIDYPIGFVRWTEQRNFEAVLDMMASGALTVGPLITHRFAIERADQAFELLASDKAALGIVIEYSNVAPPLARTIPRDSSPSVGSNRFGFIGAGNYAGRALLPAFSAAGATIASVVSNGGISAAHLARKHGSAIASTDSSAMLADESIDAVVIATRHDLHSGQVIDALRAGKHVFCEKPLCLTLDELSLIERESAKRPELHLMVGYNRRFAPHVIRIKHLLSRIAEPKSFVMTVNAGDIPRDHWTQDIATGGGRIVGEACHFIDLLRHLAGSPIRELNALSMGPHPALAIRDDKTSILMRFEDGSVGTIHYLANGHRAFPKERLEVFCAGRVIQLDNFRKMRGWGWSDFARANLWRQDKGQFGCARAFVDAVRRGLPTPITRSEIFEVAKATIEVAELARVS